MSTTLPLRTRQALARCPHLPPSRLFSTTPSNNSNIGSAPLSIPPGVTFDIHPAASNKSQRTIGRSTSTSSVSITGPLGTLSLPIPDYITIDHDASIRKAVVRIADRSERHQREMWGTTRAYLQNYLMGVSEGHSTILRLVGVGYRATIEDKASTVQAEYEGQKFVSLKLGYSHPIEMGVPRGVTASVPQPTRILLEGAEKEVVNQFAARIRKWRVPEPYKGKGIFVNGETIRLKAKKIK